jgi:hypothetical protein
MIDDHTPQTMAMQQLQGSGQMSNTLNFVLAQPNNAADKIDEMEKRVEALEAALRDAFAQPAAWRVDGHRDGAAYTWVYWKPEWPERHVREGDKVTPLYAAPLAPPAQPLTTDTIDLTNPLPGDPPIQQQPNSAVFPSFRGNNEA